VGGGNVVGVPLDTQGSGEPPAKKQLLDGGGGGATSSSGSSLLSSAAAASGMHEKLAHRISNALCCAVCLDLPKTAMYQVSFWIIYSGLNYKPL